MRAGRLRRCLSHNPFVVEGARISTSFTSTTRNRLFGLFFSHSRPPCCNSSDETSKSKPGWCKSRWILCPVSSAWLAFPQSRRNLTYLPNQLQEQGRNERPVWHQLSLYNFHPHFPPRPLNLTAIWRFAAITIHSWVKINLWDASWGQGFEDALSPAFCWLR